MFQNEDCKSILSVKFFLYVCCVYSLSFIWEIDPGLGYLLLAPILGCWQLGNEIGGYVFINCFQYFCL
jgi:hypothetical protein